MSTEWSNQFKNSGFTWLAGQTGILAGGVEGQSEITLYAGKIGDGIEYENQLRS